MDNITKHSQCINLPSEEERHPLTGFFTLSYFMTMEISPDKFPITVSVFDIKNLKNTNDNHGYEEGNKEIVRISQIIKSKFPENSYFVHDFGAKLIVLSPNMEARNTRNICEKIKEECNENVEYGLSQTKNTNDILSAISEATESAQLKQILSLGNYKSEALSLLLNILGEIDADTKEHVCRTQYLGKKIGLQLELVDIELAQLSLLCVVHDVGKICIPLSILNKAGPLTEEERKIMETHTIRGRNILMNIDELSSAANMVLHHHERWDGTGYPDGLAGKDIPILSRIVSLVDAYDAMTNDRVYRRALPKEVAIRELEKNAGTQFDPEITQIFVSTLKEENDS